MPIEMVRSHLPSRYSRGNVDQVSDAGFVPASPFYEPYSFRWCYRCQAKSQEECMVLQDLGMACETHGRSNEVR